MLASCRTVRCWPLLLALSLGACGGPSVQPRTLEATPPTLRNTTIRLYGWPGVRKLALLDDALVALGVDKESQPHEFQGGWDFAIIPLDGSVPRTLPVHPFEPLHVCIAADDQHVYWVQTRADYEDRPRQCLALGPKHVFWVDDESQTIFKVNKQGGALIPLAHGDVEQLSLVGDELYWNQSDRTIKELNWGIHWAPDAGILLRMPLAGGAATVIARSPRRPPGPAAARGFAALRQVSVRGGPVETVWQPPAGQHVGLFAVGDEHFYVTTSETLVRIPRAGGLPVALMDYPVNPGRIQLQGEVLYWTEHIPDPDLRAPDPRRIDGASLMAVSIHGGRPVVLVRNCRTTELLVRSSDVFVHNCFGVMRLPPWKP